MTYKSEGYKKYLKSLKPGDSVEICVIGGGITSSSEERKVEYIDFNADILWMEGADGDYEKDSVYAYSLSTGETISNYIPGFYNEIQMGDKYGSYLKSLKAGDTIKVCLTGAGVTSKPESRKVEYVDHSRNLLWTEGADGDYDRTSVHAYSLATGKTVSNYAQGFFSKIYFK